MADVQTISVWPASLKEIVTRKETPYKLLDSEAGFIARVAWWTLKKLNALQPYSETVREWAYVPHEQSDLHDAMLRTISDDIRYVYEGKAVFIIGGATFSELTKSPAFAGQMRFTTGPFGMQDPYHGRQMFDIPIHVVPHMTGMAVVPKAIVEKIK